MPIYKDNIGDEENPVHPETEVADATRSDHLIATTDNSSSPGEIPVNQDPNVVIESDPGYEPTEVTE